MLSVCVPVYNYNVKCLANKLAKQVNLAEFDVEVLFLDDGSDQKFFDVNKELCSVQGIRYIFQDNVGRSQTRNRLAKMAHGSYLIFIDADCDIPDDFIEKYYSYAEENVVVVGGLCYYDKPSDHSLWLRWKVGVKREVRSLEHRRKDPYSSFLSSNFMISKDLILKLGFDEKMKGYGHEDTLFGLSLKNHHIPIVHIQNAVYHLGIDRVDVYLKKLEESIDNIILVNRYLEVSDGFKLFRIYLVLKKAGLTRLFSSLFSKVEPILKKWFLEGNDSLFLLDFYKLGLLTLKMQRLRI